MAPRRRTTGCCSPPARVPFILPIPGNDLPGVITYRDIADTEAMIAAARTHRHAVVIGGGLLGLEAANGLKLRGMDVTVVHLMPWLMERQLDRTAAQMLQQSLEAKGLAFRLEAKTEALVAGESGRVASVRLASGETLAADLVVMAVGIRPNVALAKSAGLHCDRGIVVNDTLQTFDPRVYAIGECVAHRGLTYGLVAPLFEMAKVCANHLAGYGIGRYAGSQVSTKLKVTGVDLFSAGDFTGGTDTEEIVLADPARRRLQEAGHPQRQARRRRAVRRHRGRRLVFQARSRRTQHRRDPRPADVRRGQSRRYRAPGAIARARDGR